MSHSLSPSARKVQAAQAAQGFDQQVIELPESARTAVEAAKAIYLDADLMKFGWIWAAAGTPRAVFRLTPQDLVRQTGGTAMQVS